jgi:hypothetical protein
MPITVSQSTQYGGKTRQVAAGSITAQASGTRTTISTGFVGTLVRVDRVKLQRTAGTAASFTPRLYGTAAGGVGTVAQQFVGSSTAIADLFDVACTGVIFALDATGAFYLEAGPNAAADNAFDVEIAYEVL